MTDMDNNHAPELQRAYDVEMTAAIDQYNAGHLEPAFSHLERAHILGQWFPIEHASSHWWMLKVGWRSRDFVEITGQTQDYRSTTFLTNLDTSRQYRWRTCTTLQVHADP